MKDADEDTRWGVILIDTAPVEDPRAPKVIEFDLGDTGPVSCVRVSKGSYSRGARLGAPFQTDLKSHILGMMTNSPLDKLPEPFQVNYGSICSVASEDETASFVPWDLWKHKTTGVGHHADRALVGEYVGPRKLEIVASPGPEVILRSFDFTPGAWRYTKKSDASPQDKAEYPVRRAKLADRHPRGRNVTWEFSEDNVLAFVVSSGVSLELMAFSFTGYHRRTILEKNLRCWSCGLFKYPKSLATHVFVRTSSIEYKLVV